MQVRARQRGYYGVVREPGEVFDVPDNTTLPTESDGSPGWFEKVEEAPRGPRQDKGGKGGKGKDDSTDLA